MSDWRGIAIRGFTWTFTGAGAQAVLRVALMVPLARMLGPEAFGVVGAALVVVHFAMIFTNGGIPSALIQRFHLEQRHINAAWWLAFAAGALTSATLALAAPGMERFFGFSGLTEIIRALALVPMIAAMGMVPDGLLRRELRFNTLAIISFVAYAGGYGVISIGLALSGWGIWALVYALLAEQIVRTAMLWLTRIEPWQRRLDIVAAKEILAFAFGMVLRRLGHEAAQQADYAVVGRWLGAEALGLYGRAFQVAGLPTTTVGKALNVVSLPMVARLQDNHAALASAYYQTTALIAAVSLPASGILVWIAPWLVEIALGEDWLGAVVPLQILACGIMFRLLLQFQNAFAAALGGVYAAAWRSGAYAAAVIVGAIVGTRWGLPGVAFGVLAAQAFAAALGAQLCQSLIRPTEPQDARQGVGRPPAPADPLSVAGGASAGQE